MFDRNPNHLVVGERVTVELFNGDVTKGEVIRQRESKTLGKLWTIREDDGSGLETEFDLGSIAAVHDPPLTAPQTATPVPARTLSTARVARSGVAPCSAACPDMTGCDSMALWPSYPKARQPRPCLPRSVRQPTTNAGDLSYPANATPK